ncbi:unnamed protein product [Cylicocyclus nassatus]|uniref:Uncharacterized protein n=1 Tax=Cylicocyclus nassatus TaxID=53992 RepID=A0AA36GXE9_CYLNA|nr:unnamed protein product [Cylicocyclus nassatus]
MPSIALSTGWSFVIQMEENESKFPEFALEKEFQCHNTQLVKEVVCKTIQKFVKNPQDVRLAITVSFQPHITGNDNSHEQEAIATVEVDKPGNFYPGGQEQRVRNKELEVLRQVERTKQQERREMRKLAREEEERKRRKMETGVKRPSGGTVHERARMTRVAPPLPFKAETRRLPSGEMYAVREWVYSYTEKEPFFPLPVTSNAFGEPMIVRETKFQGYEHWHFTPDSEPDAHAAELQGTVGEERKALEKGDSEPKGEPRSAIPSTAGVKNAKEEDREGQKLIALLPGPPQKAKEVKKQKKEPKKRPSVNVRKITIVEPKVYKGLVEPQSEGLSKQTLTSQSVIVLSQEGQSKLHAQTIPSSGTAPEVESSNILDTDQQTPSARSTSSASTDTVEEGSLHEFKTPPGSSSTVPSPVLTAKNVEDAGVVKPSSGVPVSAPPAALPKNEEKETPQKAQRILDVTTATISLQKPPEEVIATQPEKASTTDHLVTPSLDQEVPEEMKEKTKPHPSTVTQSVTPSDFLSTSTEEPKISKSAPKQPVETITAPRALVPEIGKEEEQKKTLEEAVPSTALDTVDQDQLKATTLPQLQANVTEISSASRREEEDKQHKVVSDASKEAHKVITTITHQVVKEEKMANLMPAPAAFSEKREGEEKPKEARVPVSAISVGPPSKIEEEKTVRKEPAIPSAALLGSAEEEVKPKRAEVLLTPFPSNLEEKAKKAEPTPTVVPMPAAVEEMKHTKSDGKRAASTFRYTIRSEGSREIEEEEKPKIFLKPPLQPDMLEAVKQLKTTKVKPEQKPIQHSPESSLSGSAEEQERKNDVSEAPIATHPVGPPSTLPKDIADERKITKLPVSLTTSAFPSAISVTLPKQEDEKTMPQLPLFKPPHVTSPPSKPEPMPPIAKVDATPQLAVLPEGAKEETSENIKPQTVIKAHSATPIVQLETSKKLKATQVEINQSISKDPATAPFALPGSAEEEKTEKVEVTPFPPAVSPTRVPLKVVEVLNYTKYKRDSSMVEKTKATTFDSKPMSEISAPTSPSVFKTEQEEKEKNIEPRLLAMSESPHRPTILPFKIGADVEVTKVKPKQPIISSAVPNAALQENVNWTKPEGFSLDIRKKTPPLDQPTIPSPKALEEVKIANLELQQPVHVEDSVVLALTSSKETEKTRSPLPIAEPGQKATTKLEETLQKPQSKAETVQSQSIPMRASKKESEAMSTVAISPTSLPSPPTEKKMKFERLPTLSPKVIKDKKHYKRKVVHSHVEPQPLIPVDMTTELDDKAQKSEPRRPSVEEMNAVRELGSPRDDATDRDGLSLETIDVQSAVDLPQHETFYIAMPDDSRIETKGSANIQGSIKLEDDGKSPKVLAYINVG